MKKIVLCAGITVLFVGGVTSSVAFNKGDRLQQIINKKFERIDTNKDGIISAQEHMAHAQQRFEKMDINGDGLVTKEEIKSYREAKRAERRANR